MYPEFYYNETRVNGGPSDTHIAFSGRPFYCI